mgnify:CR=1 FL=1
MKIDDNQLQTLIDICNIYLIKIQKGGFLDD